MDENATFASPTRQWSATLLPRHIKTFQSLAHAHLQRYDIHDPLTTRSFSAINASLRHGLIIEGHGGWLTHELESIGLSREQVRLLEKLDDAANPAAHNTRPLNLGVLFSVPSLAEAYFGPGRPISPLITAASEQRYWELAWDFANAVETNWHRGMMKLHEGNDAEVDQRIAAVKKLISDKLEGFGVLVETLAWQPQQSPYASLLGPEDRQRKLRVHQRIDPTVKPPDAQQVYDLASQVWFLTDRYSSLRQLRDRLGCDHRALDSFLGRYTEPAKGSQGQGASCYSARILELVPEIYDFLKAKAPADSFDAYQQGRFLCYAEQYAIRVMRYSQDDARINHQRYSAISETAWDGTIPQLIGEFVTKHPQKAYRAGKTFGSELMRSTALNTLQANGESIPEEEIRR